MTDITNTNLEAAIIDQKVAGTFWEKLYAYVAVIDEKEGWALGVAVANEKGYSPIGGKTFKWKVEAQELADGLNQHIGLTRDQVAQIVISTMGGRPVVIVKENGRRVMQ
jgi:hypothetical protein